MAASERASVPSSPVASMALEMLVNRVGRLSGSLVASASGAVPTMPMMAVETRRSVAVPAAISAVWHVLIGSLLAGWWRRRG